MHKVLIENWNPPRPEVQAGDMVWMRLIEYIPHLPSKPFKVRVHTPEGCGQVLTETNMFDWPSAPHVHTVCTECLRDGWDDYVIWKA